MSDHTSIGLPLPSAEVSAGLTSGEPNEERFARDQYCVFRRGRERYCLLVSEVEEVVEWSALTRVPLAPPFLMGILNLRGVIIPVLDIAFMEDRISDSAPTHLVVAVWGNESDRGAMRVGLAVDEMFGTCFGFEPLLMDEAPTDLKHCRGMLRHDNRLALALHLPGLAEAFPIPTI